MLSMIVHRHSGIAMFCALWCAGCTNFGRQDSGLASYEAAKRQIEQAPHSGVEHVSYQEAVDDGLELGDFAPNNLSSTLKKLAGKGPNVEASKQTYEIANQLFQVAAEARRQNPQADLREQFNAAAAQFRLAANQWPNSTLEHDALKNLGESLFFADEYPRAEAAFEELLAKYPNSKHLDRIQPLRFGIAQYWLQLDEVDHQGFHEVNLTDPSRPRRDTFGHAVRVLDRIRLDDPTGDRADDATLTLGNAFFRRGKFIRADEYYTDLRKTFPSSEHQFHAHFLGLKAKLMSYQGHDYSANALREAEKIAKQIRRQFPAEAEQEREYLNLASAEIRFKQAEREWQLAQHYDKRAEFGAARFYYQAILSDYGDTPFADRSSARLREIGGLPEVPPQRLSWLVEFFPDAEDDTPALSNNAGRTQLR